MVECIEGGAELSDLLPGVTVHGLDVGRWMERQRQHIVRQVLMDEQRIRPAALGIRPNAAPAEKDNTAKRPGTGNRTPSTAAWPRSPGTGSEPGR
ncbi:hypothetical protein KNE206_54170 [Kitasatospora sp. NE20-6]|uniref:hypothetical protein n=1 Tax=Kitasatospora sp. NE20-6 TaxID=2859066 RepID=UPI0034DC436D